MQIFYPVAFCMAVLGACDFTLYFTDGGSLAPPPGSNVNNGRRLQEPMPTYWLSAVTYDDGGTIKRKLNITGPKDGMGYISVSLDASRVLFATERVMPEGWKNVDTFLVDLHGNAQFPKERLLLQDEAALIKPCAKAGCMQASTFHAVFAYDNKSVIFAYRAWTILGYGVGSQALGMSNIDGTNVRPLTYDVANVQVMDMCPTLLEGVPDVIVFSRNSYGHTIIAMLNTTTGKVTEFTNWPKVADGSGCPAALGPKQPSSFMYLGCDHYPEAIGSSSVSLANRWGLPKGMMDGIVQLDGCNCRQLKVTVDSKNGNTTLEEMFKVPLTDAPGYEDVLSTSQCDRVWGADQPHNTSIFCEGADKDHLFLLKFGVSPTTGKSARNDTQTLKQVMTPRPFSLFYSSAQRSDMYLI